MGVTTLPNLKNFRPRKYTSDQSIIIYCLSTSQSKHLPTSLGLLRFLTLSTSMPFFITVEANNVIMLAICNLMTLLTTTVTPLHFTSTSVTLMALLSTSVTRNFSRCIPLLNPLIIGHLMLTLISRSTVRLRTTLLILTPPLLPDLLISFCIFFLKPANAHPFPRSATFLYLCEGA